MRVSTVIALFAKAVQEIPWNKTKIQCLRYCLIDTKLFYHRYYTLYITLPQTVLTLCDCSWHEFIIRHTEEMTNSMTSNAQRTLLQSIHGEQNDENHYILLKSSIIKVLDHSENEFVFKKMCKSEPKVSAVTSQQGASGFEPVVWLGLRVWRIFPCFLWVLRLSPTVQRHADEVIRLLYIIYKVWMCMWMAVFILPFQ